MSSPAGGHGAGSSGWPREAPGVGLGRGSAGAGSGGGPAGVPGVGPNGEPIEVPGVGLDGGLTRMPGVEAKRGHSGLAGADGGPAAEVGDVDGVTAAWSAVEVDAGPVVASDVESGAGVPPAEGEFVVDSVDEDGVGRTGARFGPYSARRGKRGKRSAEPLEGSADESSVSGGEDSFYRSGTRGFGGSPAARAEEQAALPWASAIVRPYAHTGGRTRSSHDLALEALISADRWVPSASATPQRRMIMSLCAQPRSVAEVAALLSVPLGVARVLLGDLATDGAVVVHPTAGAQGAAPDVEIMQRVLVGLRRL